MREILRHGGSIVDVMTNGFKWNAALEAWLDLIFIYLPRETNDERAWAMVLQHYGPGGILNGPAGPPLGRGRWLVRTLWTTHLRRLRYLGQGKLTIDFELAPDTDVLHFHFHFYANAPKDGIVHSTMQMLGLPTGDSKAPWSQKCKNTKAFLDYITNDTKEGKFKGTMDWGPEPESEAVATVANPTPVARQESGKDFRFIFDAAASGSVHSIRCVAKLYLDGTITNVAQIERSMSNGVIGAMVDMKAENDLKGIAGQEKMFITVHGGAGVGKDRWAKYFYCRAYIEKNFPCGCNDTCNCFQAHVYVKTGETKWWPGYFGQPCVIFSDWQCCKDASDPMKWSFHECLTITDRINPTYYIQVKNDSVLFRAQVIIFTMNSSLAHAMPDVGADALRFDGSQLTRRINWCLTITSAPHADPRDWTYKTEFYNKPTENDVRNLTKNGIVQLIAKEGDDYRNAEGDVVAQTTIFDELMQYSFRPIDLPAPPTIVRMVADAPQFQELTTQDPIELSGSSSDESDEGRSLFAPEPSGRVVSPSIFDISGPAALPTNDAIHARRRRLRETREKAADLMRKRKRD